MAHTAPPPAAAAPARRFAIYARYSSDRQLSRSIDDQVALDRAYGEGFGWTLHAVYADYELSGATLHRPEFQRMMADAKAGRFDIVVVEDVDRLARGEGDMPQLRRQLEFHGVDIHSLADGHVTKLHAGLKGLMSSMFLDNLALHTRRGMEGAVRAGRSAGGRAYGYRPVHGQPGALTIDEAEAAIVRRIFAAYNGGATPRAIAHALNRDGVPPPRGRRWNASTLNGNLKRGHGILLNPLYAGRLVWNKVRMIKDPATGRRISRPNPPEQHRSAERPELAIVEPSLFARVQAQKRDRGHAPPQSFRKPQRLLSGLIRCGRCGGGMTVQGKDKSGRARLYCSTRRESGGCDNSRTMYVEAIERCVVAGLKAKLAAPRYLAAYVETYVAERKRLVREGSRKRAAHERRLGDIARESERLVDAIAKHGADAGPVFARLRALESERIAAEAALAAAPGPPDRIALHHGAVEAYRRDIEELARRLAAPGPAGEWSDAAEALRRLVAEVVVHPAPAGTPCQIEIKGRLAELIGAPAFPADRLVWSEAVAGERYRRSPTLRGPLFTFRTPLAA